MTAVVPVRPEFREILGAVTHVDGTARVQTVSREASERYWHLIEEFRKRTGVPVVLNTSFNNHVEPIVNSPLDAMNCFLSTALDGLVLGDFLVEKKTSAIECLLSLVPILNPRFEWVRRTVAGTLRHELHDKYDDAYEVVEPGLVDSLWHAVETKQVLRSAVGPHGEPSWMESLHTLWERRVFLLAPREWVERGISAFRV